MINIKCSLIFSILFLLGCQNTSPIVSNLSIPAQSLYLDGAFNSNVSYLLESEEEVFKLDDDIGDASQQNKPSTNGLRKITNYFKAPF
jgi:hypothetical protein